MMWIIHLKKDRTPNLVGLNEENHNRQRRQYAAFCTYAPGRRRPPLVKNVYLI